MDPRSNEFQKINRARGGFDPVHKVLLVVGMAGPVLTYAFAVSSFSPTVKIGVLAVIALFYLGVCVWAYSSFQKDEPEAAGSAAREMDTEEAKDVIAERLHAIEEAREFFGSSLKSSDMFRLVSSRVSELVPFSASLLLLPTEDSDGLEPFHSHGDDAGRFVEGKAESSKSISGMAFLSGEVEIDPDLALERTARTETDLSGLVSSAAIPLRHEDAVFGIFQIFSGERIEAADDTRELLRAIGEKIGPLFLSARSVDRSMTSALIDPLTKLPNERAFYMVLENQLAESQRLREERPLTILALDIKEFDAANLEYGHATGDKILCHTAEVIGSKLRKMDFLVRASADEFLIILPTAREQTANDVLARVIEGLEQSEYDVTENESVKIRINFGSATFWQDGETAEQLLRQARERKQLAKAEEEGKVVRFSKEYIN